MPKMRIQLKDTNGVVQTDRLVEQQLELTNGPKDRHEGHVTLEVTLQSPADVKLFKHYIDQLSGSLPLHTKASSTPTKVNPYKEIYKDVVTKKSENMEAVIDYLMSLDFKFVTKQFIHERIELNRLEQKFEDLPNDYQYLVRLSKVAKDPTNDKYDFTLIFGINLFKQGKFIKVFRDSEPFKKLKSTWKDHRANMKTKKIPLVFPKFMTIDERTKWRKIHRFLRDNKPISNKDNLFYERYKPDIKNLEFEN